MDEAQKAFALLSDVRRILQWTQAYADDPNTPINVLTEVRTKLEHLVTDMIDADKLLGKMPTSPKVDSLRRESRLAVGEACALTFAGRVPPLTR